MFAYFLEFMLTFDKMQNTSPLTRTKFELLGQSILKVIKALLSVRRVLYIECSATVVECLNKIKLFQSTVQPLGHENIRLIARAPSPCCVKSLP